MGLSERAAGGRYELSVTYLHLVWGRVVPDIPAFCRELVAAWMAEEEEEMLVLTRGDRAVVLVYEDGGMVQLSTPQDLRGATGG